jgi:cell division protein FtsL
MISIIVMFVMVLILFIIFIITYFSDLLKIHKSIDKRLEHIELLLDKHKNDADMDYDTKE